MLCREGRTGPRVSERKPLADCLVEIGEDAWKEKVTSRPMSHWGEIMVYPNGERS